MTADQHARLCAKLYALASDTAKGDPAKLMHWLIYAHAMWAGMKAVEEEQAEAAEKFQTLRKGVRS